MNTLKFPSLIAGCMRWGKWGANFSTAQYGAMINACLEAGISTFDHADIYGGYTTEAEFGHALFALGSKTRQQIQLISKCGIQLISENRPQHHIKAYNTTTKHIITSVENSLTALHTDYLDVLLLHRPDFLLNIESIAECFYQLKQSGKVKSFGVSNFTPSQMSMLKSVTPIVTNQVEYSLVATAPMENGVFDFCQEHQIRPMAWSPLGMGKIDHPDHTDRYQRIFHTAQQLSQKYQLNANQLLIAWVAQHPSKPIPVVGSSRIERLKEAQLATTTTLDTEDWYLLLRAATNEDVA